MSFEKVIYFWKRNVEIWKMIFFCWVNWGFYEWIKSFQYFKHQWQRQDFFLGLCLLEVLSWQTSWRVYRVKGNYWGDIGLISVLYWSLWRTNFIFCKSSWSSPEIKREFLLYVGWGSSWLFKLEEKSELVL